MGYSLSCEYTEKDDNDRSELLVLVFEETDKEVDELIKVEALGNILKKGDILEGFLIDFTFDEDVPFPVEVLKLYIYHGIYYNNGKLFFY